MVFKKGNSNYNTIIIVLNNYNCNNTIIITRLDKKIICLKMNMCRIK